MGHITYSDVLCNYSTHVLTAVHGNVVVLYGFWVSLVVSVSKNGTPNCFGYMFIIPFRFINVRLINVDHVTSEVLNKGL